MAAVTWMWNECAQFWGDFERMSCDLWMCGWRKVHGVGAVMTKTGLQGAVVLVMVLCWWHLMIRGGGAALMTFEDKTIWQIGKEHWKSMADSVKWSQRKSFLFNVCLFKTHCLHCQQCILIYSTAQIQMFYASDIIFHSGVTRGLFDSLFLQQHRHSLFDTLFISFIYQSTVHSLG